MSGVTSRSTKWYKRDKTGRGVCDKKMRGVRDKKNKRGVRGRGQSVKGAGSIGRVALCSGGEWASGLKDLEAASSGRGVERAYEGGDLLLVGW